MTKFKPNSPEAQLWITTFTHGINDSGMKVPFSEIAKFADIAVELLQERLVVSPKLLRQTRPFFDPVKRRGP